MSGSADEQRVGLCATCVHAARVRSSKGSEFWLCRLAETDSRFRKYPALPMMACSGYGTNGTIEVLPTDGCER